MGQGSDRARMEGILRAIANPINLEILALLSAKPSYTREIARMLGRDEADVSRRLKLLEKLGLVRGYWMRLEDRNIRMYELTARSLRIDFTSRGVVIDKGSGEGGVIPPLPSIARSIPVPSLFIGREREAGVLRGLDYRVCVVWGMGGVGKTSLAAAALSGIDQLFWFRFSEMDTLDYLLWRMGFHASSLGEPMLLDALGSMGSSSPGVLDIAVDAMSRTGTVVVLDDYHKVEDTRIGSFVRSKLVRGAGRYRLVILSRRRPRGIPYHEEGVKEIQLGGLNRRETKELVEALTGREAREDEVDAIYSSTGGHPLLIKLTVKAGRSGAAAYVWDELVSGLSDTERRLLQSLAAFDEPLQPGLITAITGMKDPLPTLMRLHDKGLVEAAESGFKVHDTIKTLIPSPARAVLYEKAARALEKGGWASRLKAMKYYLKAGNPRAAARIIAWRVRTFDYTVWPYISTYKDLVHEVARRVEGTPEEPYVLVEASKLAYSLDADAEASWSLAMRALSAARAQRDERAVMEALIAYGTLASDSGRVEEGLHALMEALRLARKLGVGPRKLFNIYSSLSMALANTGRIEEAVRAARAQLSEARATGDEYYILSSQANLGGMLAIAGMVGEAEEMLRKVYNSARMLGLDSLLVQTLVELGDLYEEQGRREELEWCIAELDRLSGPRSYRYLEALKTLYRARVMELSGRQLEALSLAGEALEAARRIGVQNIEANVRLLMARVCRSLGRREEALEHLRAACRMRGWSSFRVVREAPTLAKDLGVDLGEIPECGWVKGG